MYLIALNLIIVNGLIMIVIYIDKGINLRFDTLTIMRTIKLIVSYALIIKITYTVNLRNIFEELDAKLNDDYPNYNLILHYDNNMRDILTDNGFFNKFSSIGSRLLINYDRNLIKNRLKRPYGYKFINLICMCEPYKFARYINDTENVYFRDVNIFLMINYDFMIENNVWDNVNGLENTGSTILIDLNENDYYYVMYYKENRSKILIKINRTSILSNYVNKFRDFNGHIFNVGFVTQKPYVFCTLVPTYVSLNIYIAIIKFCKTLHYYFQV